MATLTWFNLTWLLNVVKVALGLGFVIFLHELGHFLLAKWNGVKVEKFSIGFGRTLLGFKRGETEYVIAAIPLGGFVKMLGEGPEDEANKSSDPRAYPNKSVGARMAIISAGVIMNLLLGLACFVYAHGRGMDEVPAKIGAVKAGAPAYEAGIRPGDEIVAIDGREDLKFDHLRLKVRLSSEGQRLHFHLKRPGQTGLVPLDIEPRREPTEEMPTIGVAPGLSLTLDDPPFEAPAGMTDPPKQKDAGLKRGDILIEVGPDETTLTPVQDVEELHRLLARYQDKPLVAAFRRLEAEESRRGIGREVAQGRRVALPPNHFVDFGFRLTIEPVSSFRAGSPAAKAGFRKGDRIVSVDGDKDFDPMRLPSLCYAGAGKEMTFEVERVGSDKAPTIVTLKVTPDDTPPWTELAFPNEPLKVPGLGLAYPVRTRIVAIEEGSPAAKVGLKVGDVISSLTFPPPHSDTEKAKPIELKFDERSPDWPRAFSVLQLLPRQGVELTVNNSEAPIPITPEPDPTWFHPLRGLRFRPEIIHLPPQGVGVALRRGWSDSIDNVLGIYAMLRSLAQQRVSTKALGGPPAIIQMAYLQAASSLTDLVYFLGILSINLAVLNFLPIPPLDGGQMVFLIAEKVRGRPLPDSAVIAGSWLGLLLVLCLMVFVIFQDVTRMLSNSF
ncbi:MAG: RIP metalloprotease RseP [Planctomycetaceae bacterium]